MSHRSLLLALQWERVPVGSLLRGRAELVSSCAEMPWGAADAVPPLAPFFLSGRRLRAPDSESTAWSRGREAPCSDLRSLPGPLRHTVGAFASMWVRAACLAFCSVGSSVGVSAGFTNSQRNCLLPGRSWREMKMKGSQFLFQS